MTGGGRWQLPPRASEVRLGNGELGKLPVNEIYQIRIGGFGAPRGVQANQLRGATVWWSVVTCGRGYPERGACMPVLNA